MNKKVSLETVVPIKDLEVGGCRFAETEDGKVMKTCPADLDETPKVDEYEDLIDEQQKLIEFFMDNFRDLSANAKFFRMIADAKSFGIKVPEVSGDDGVYRLHLEREDGGHKRIYDVEITDAGLDGIYDGIKVTGRSMWAGLKDEFEQMHLAGPVAALEGEQFHGLIMALAGAVADPAEPVGGNYPLRFFEIPLQPIGGDLPWIYLEPRPGSESKPKEPPMDLTPPPICRDVPELDPGFYIELPPLPPGVDPFPFPVFEIPGPSLDPCFNPCSPECLDRDYVDRGDYFRIGGIFYLTER